MSWEDIMRRVLPPIGGVPPHITSRYGEEEGRPPGSTKPHRDDLTDDQFALSAQAMESGGAMKTVAHTEHNGPGDLEDDASELEATR